ncbi:MAG: hypothetical protein ABI769_16550 [Pseudomonadota bacterium]
MNRNLYKLAFLALALVSDGAGAADPKPASCAGAQWHQFDFWIGHWKVTAGGKPAGTSHIEAILDGCAFLEHWQSNGGGDGKSLNFYDRRDSLWHQTWIDRSGTALNLAGKFENGAMRLEATSAASAGQPATRQRITWTSLPGGKVRQLWESAPVDKDEWTTQFDGLYEPAK